MKHLIMLSLALLASLAVCGQQPYDGSWAGDLVVQGTKLPLVFNVSGDTATIDSPAQGAMGIPVSSVEYVDGSIVISAAELGMTFTGSRINDSCIAGIFSQGGFSMYMTLVRREQSGPNRPQEPQPPYPYRVEEVEFASAADGVVMHGTLTLPDDDKRHCGVVLVTGSGTQNRDEEIFGHKPFKVIADRLTRRGIAVLRYDDREFTTGKYEGATTLDYAADALRAVEYLRSRPEVDAANVGIAGHSEGGTIAFVCAAEDPQISFVVSLAGMTVSGAECLISQNRLALNQAALKAGGLDAALVDDICAVVGYAFGSMKGMTAEDIRANADSLLGEAVARASRPESVGVVRDALARSLNDMSEWLAFFIGYDPAESISKIGCRVLALNGAKDMQVAADDNLGRLHTFDNLAGRLETHRLEGLNHLFQHCDSGLITEYPLIDETFSDEVLTMIADWILN